MKRWFAALLFLLTACAPLPGLSPAVYQEPTPLQLALFAPRPADSPDVLIFGISGRCAPPCQAPQDSWDYLSERGTLKAIAQVFEQRGLKVEVHGYAELIARDFTSRRSAQPQHGILDLIDDYRRLSGEWVLARRNPSRIILVGHSHGSVWSHYLSALFPQVPVAAQIDLDGICAAWNADHAAFVPLAQDAPWTDNPLLSPLRACGTVKTGNTQTRLKDVAWPNVAYNFEVQSKRLPAAVGQSGGVFVNYLFELTPNVRLDGSKTGIQTFVSVHEDHSAVSAPNSEAVAWVKSQLATLPWLAPLLSAAPAPPQPLLNEPLAPVTPSTPF